MTQPLYFTDRRGRTRQWCPDCQLYVPLRRWPLLSLHWCPMRFA